MSGVLWKVQEICNKMGIIICKIFEDMSKIIEPKVGNPKNSVSRNWAISSHPWNLAFFEDEIFNFFLNHMVQKYQNKIAPIFYYGIITKTNEKDLKIPTYFTAPWLKTSLVNVPDTFIYCLQTLMKWCIHCLLSIMW